MVDEVVMTALIESARGAVSSAYAPYSDYKVGAAVLAGDGRIFTGANIENAAYGETICAERVAVAKAVSEGARDIEALATAAEDGRPAAPCGACRQVIAEFSPDCLIIMAGESETIVKPLTELLPLAFKLKR